MRLIGYVSQRVLSKIDAATSSGEYTAFTCSNRKTEAVPMPVYVGDPANDNLEAQKQRTANIVAQVVAQEQLKKLYVELTNGQAIGEDFGDGEYAHQGYLITNEQLDRLAALLGIEVGK